MLAAYPGALLLVSHDAAMVEAATSVVWKTRPVAGGYELVVG